MSSNPLDSVIVPTDAVRDMQIAEAGIAVNYAIDLANTANCLGLDLFIRNRGAAGITVSLNGGAAITVDAGDVYIVNHFKMWLVQIVSAVLYDLQIFGIRVNTLKRMGLLSG